MLNIAVKKSSSTATNITSYYILSHYRSSFRGPEFGTVSVVIFAIALIGIVVAGAKYSTKASMIPEL